MPPTPSARETIPARTTTDLIGHAEALGIRVLWADDAFPDRGRYYPGIEVILLRAGMSERRTLSTLAHELAHHHYGDFCTASGPEARARRYAAELLISPAEYALAEMLDSAPGAIAHELGVTTEVVAAYQASRSAAA